MIALEVALERPAAVGHVVPIGAPAATGALAIAWNHIQLELVDRLGEQGLALARQLAMTTYRSEADFDGRFGRAVRARTAGSPSSRTSTTRATSCWAASTRTRTRVLVRIMDGHDVGRGRGGMVEAFRSLADGRDGADRHRHRGRPPLRARPGAGGWSARPRPRAWTPGYREIETTKGHDAFLIEWDQLTVMLSAALADGLARVERRVAAGVGAGPG